MYNYLFSMRQQLLTWMTGLVAARKCPLGGKDVSKEQVSPFILVSVVLNHSTGTLKVKSCEVC